MKCLTHGRYWINMSWPKNIKNLYFQHQCWHNQLSIALYLRWLWESLWKPSTAFLWHHKSLKQYFWQYRWNSSILRDDNQFISVQFSHSVVSDSSRPHESQHTRPPCPSPTPRVHSNSRDYVVAETVSKLLRERPMEFHLPWFWTNHWTPSSSSPALSSSSKDGKTNNPPLA